MKIKLVVSYDGTNYCGWQRQKNALSIQEVLEDALFNVCGQKITVTASGRTDAGVHAEGQVVSFDYQGSIPAERFFLALNSNLPDDIRVLSSSREDDGFNARKSAKKKTYSYSFYLSKTALPMKDRFALHLEKEPNFNLMEEAKSFLVGKHDFKAFCATKSSVKSTERIIYSIDLVKGENYFEIVVCGNGFLYNMVRIIAGTLLDVGYQKKNVEDIKKALETGKREYLSKTLSPKGLKLKEVEYTNS